MDWPARSPDLNPIESLWVYIVTNLYKDFRQFDNLESLSEAIALSWDSIRIELLKKLVRSKSKRCKEVIEDQGGQIHY